MIARAVPAIGAAVLGAALTAALVDAQDPSRTKPEVVEWATALSEKLAAALPSGIDGLVDALPWESMPSYPELNHGCPVSCTELAPATALRAWSIDDPDLVAAHAAAAAKAERDAAVLAAELARLDLTRPDPAKLAEFERRQRAIEESTQTLERSGRRVELMIEGNLPLRPRGVEAAPVASAPIKGLPVMRYQADDASYAPVTRSIRLGVFIGPSGFTNRVVQAANMRAELRGISVWAAVQTTPAKAAGDEALLRKLLDQVDFEALKALLSAR